MKSRGMRSHPLPGGRSLLGLMPLVLLSLLAVGLLLPLSVPVHATSVEELQPCALLEGTDVPYSQVPRGWTAEAWIGAIAAAYPEEEGDATARPVVCLPPPDQGDYAIGNPIPEVGIENLGYTARDWERWDGFDAREDLMYTPSRFGRDNEAQLRKANANPDQGPVVWGIGDGSGTSLHGVSIRHSEAPLSYQTAPEDLGQPVTGETYLRAFKAQLHNVMFPRGYAWFRSYARNKELDWIKELQKSKRLDMTGAILNVSFALNENYNNLRKSVRTNIRNRILADLKKQNVNPASRARSIEAQIDSEWDAYKISDWLGGNEMPRNQATLDWFERLLLQYINGQQCLTPGTMVQEGNRMIDAFGLFEGLDGPGYRQSLLYFYAGDWAYLTGRWVKLLRTDVIRRVRQSMYASLAASYASYLYRIDVEDRLSNQWLMRIASITSSVYTLLRSEAVLKARGVWKASDYPAGSGSTNWAQGKITNADMLSFAESYTLRYVVRLERWGLTEYLSTYYGLSFDILVQAINLAPTQRIYELLERIWKILNYDTYNNFLPAAAAASGPSGRHYDMTTGLHGLQDYWDTELYTCILFPPHCAVKEVKERYDGQGNVETIVNLCTQHSPTLAPITEGYNDFNAHRIHHAALQAAGYHYNPFDAIFNFTVGKQARISYSLTTNQRGQERYNFFSPLGATLSLGWGAEESWGSGLENTHVGRLGGVPVPGSSKAVIKKHAATQVHALLRLMVENSDNPFYRASEYGVVSHEIQQFARHITAQHQGFMLTTFLVAGRNDDKGKYNSAPWNTDILLPVTTDSLWADGTRLPVTAGTVIALPRNVIITARHKDSTFVVRLLRAEVNPGIKETSSVRVLSTSASSSVAANYVPKKGKQEYSVTWQVDSASLLAGCGRITIHHKHAGDSNVRPWRVTTLWGSGQTRSDAEMFSLQRTIRHAAVTESVREEKGWDASDQPTYGSPKRSWDGRSTLGQAVWSTEVQVGPSGTNKGGIHLKVVRTDVYQPWSNDPIYRHKTAPMHIAPYYFQAGFERLGQGVDDFVRFFSGMEKDNFKGPSMRSQALGWDAVLAPHLTSPLECVPGVDSPCYQWRLVGSWSSCSASCRGGVRSRSVRCADASGSNPNTAVDDSMCLAALKPPSVEACNTQACLPGAPSIERVQATDGYVRVWWRAPSDDGGDKNPLRYVALTAPTSVATSAAAATSPMLVGPLTNGQSYTVRLAAVNSAGTGPFSSPSLAVVPDKFAWTYSSWSACSRPCGSGGEQTRTVSCKGASTGATSNDVCIALLGAVPTDLRQSCGTQPCVWSAGNWGTCSRPCSSGTQTRSITCTAGTGGATVPNSYCVASSAPASTAACNTQACAWVAGSWTACSKPCDGGTQTRSLSCSDGKGNTNVAASTCQETVGNAPSTSQSCNTQSCQPNQWRAGAWGACSQPCGPGGSQSRVVECVTPAGSTISASDCTAATKPPTQQTCNSASCLWRVHTEWDACSAPCNGGTRARTTVCVEPVSGAAVPSERCAASGLTAPSSTEACNTHACTWAASPWGICSASCGVGSQERRVWCSDGSAEAKEVEASFCAKAEPRPTTQECGTALTCIEPPPTPSITLVEGGDQRATVYFTTSSGTTSEGVEYIVDALPEPADQAGGGAGDGTTPVQSSFEVVSGGSQPPPQQGALEVDADGNPIATDDTDAPSPGALPPLAALTSWSRSSPVVVLGLVNGVRYHFTVLAVNAAGSSPKSAPSEPPVRAFPPPSAPPRFLRVALLPEDEVSGAAERKGVLLVFFEANHTVDAFEDTPPPYFVVTAEPQIPGQISVLTTGTPSPGAAGGELHAADEAPKTVVVPPPMAAGFVEGEGEEEQLAPETTTTAATDAPPAVSFLTSYSANGTSSPLRLTGLDPSVQYRLTLSAVNGAGSSERALSQSVYRADPAAPEWSQAGFGNEAGMADVPVDGVEAADGGTRGASSSGLSGGEIAAAVLVPLLVALAAVGGGLFWRWRSAKADRRTDSSAASSTQGSPDVSRDASREVSRSKGPYHAPALQLHGEAAGDLEADQLPTSPLNKHPPKPPHMPARPPPSAPAHARRRSSHVQVSIDDMHAVMPPEGGGREGVSVSSFNQPHFHGRDSHANPLSPAGTAAAKGIAASLAEPSPSPSPSPPLGSPSLDAAAAGTHQQSFPPSSSPRSPPPRMSPPPPDANAAAANMAASPSPSPSPEPLAPFLRRAPH